MDKHTSIAFYFFILLGIFYISYDFKFGRKRVCEGSE